MAQSRPRPCFHPGTPHYSACVQVWNSCGTLKQPLPALAACFVISRSLTSWRLSCRLKWKTNRTSRTSPVWWLWRGPTPPPSPTSSPSMTSAFRRSAATTRLTCKMFIIWNQSLMIFLRVLVVSWWWGARLGLRPLVKHKHNQWKLICYKTKALFLDSGHFSALMSLFSWPHQNAHLKL